MSDSIAIKSLCLFFLQIQDILHERFMPNLLNIERKCIEESVYCRIDFMLTCKTGQCASVFRKYCVFFTINCNPSLACIYHCKIFKVLNKNRVYSYTYWLAFFWTTNCSKGSFMKFPLLPPSARVRLQYSEKFLEKKNSEHSVCFLFIFDFLFRTNYFCVYSDIMYSGMES